MIAWKTLRRETVYHHSKWLTVENHVISLPDGRVIDLWPWIISPDFVNIAVRTDDGRYLCFRQTKYAIEGTGLAPIGGYLEPGEEPLFAAQRELAEETGYEAHGWTLLGGFPVDGNHGAGRAYLYLASDARRVKDTVSDDLEDQEIVLLSETEVRSALVAGEFKVLSWATTMALALLHPENS
jgi:ADP-ribose pyrophosphatase